MEKIQAALSHAPGEGRTVMAPFSGTQQSSIKTTAQDHPTVHTKIDSKDEDALPSSPSTRQHPDVRMLVRQSMCKVSNWYMCEVTDRMMSLFCHCSLALN